LVAERFDLANEYRLASVVVQKARQNRRIRRQRDCWKRTALDDETADQLGGNVLSVGRTSAVATEKELSTPDDRIGDAPGHGRNLPCRILSQRSLHICALGEGRRDNLF
jgi:hypothetical protein